VAVGGIGVFVGVLVDVAVAVASGVFVGVCVGLGVAVAVGVAVGSGSGHTGSMGVRPVQDCCESVDAGEFVRFVGFEPSA